MLGDASSDGKTIVAKHILTKPNTSRNVRFNRWLGKNEAAYLDNMCNKLTQDVGKELLDQIQEAVQRIEGLEKEKETIKSENQKLKA